MTHRHVVIRSHLELHFRTHFSQKGLTAVAQLVVLSVLLLHCRAPCESSPLVDSTHTKKPFLSHPRALPAFSCLYFLPVCRANCKAASSPCCLTLFPYLAGSFSAIFCSLLHKRSKFHSLEHNYPKYFSSGSSTLIFDGFSRGSLSS